MQPEYSTYLLNSQDIQMQKMGILIIVLFILFMISALINLLFIIHYGTKKQNKDDQ